MAHERRNETTQLVIAMVGLPARGKSFMAHRLRRYLGWLGYRTRVFNVGSYRRERLGAHHREDFFAPENDRGRQVREALADAALADLLDWMRAGGEVGIYDATNTTMARRARVSRRLEQAGIRVLFIESVCDDEALVDANIRATKLTGPDYAGMAPAEALADFRARVRHYAAVYEPMQQPESGFIKVIDAGRRLEVDGVRGYLPGKVLFFLANSHADRRPILLSRHGESRFNLEGRIGGNPGLSARGEAYAGALAEFVAWRFGPEREVEVFTSTLLRTQQTAASIPWPATGWRALDEIDAGICDSRTYDEIAAALPDEYAARQADKFHYRYPGGESYRDVIGRVEPVILEIERQRRPVLVIAHQAIVRVLYAYFRELPAEDCPYLPVPLHTVIELRQVATGLEEERHVLLSDES
jgi:broad specificity phosphatase PhoE/predicted kinase